MEYVEISGRRYPVTEEVLSAGFGVLPVVDIPQMSDEAWQAMCRREFLRKYEQEHGPQPDFPESAYLAFCADVMLEEE